MPSGSQLAIPIRTDPTSMASLLPDLKTPLPEIGTATGADTARSFVSESIQPGRDMVSRYATRRSDAGNNRLNRIKRLCHR